MNELKVPGVLLLVGGLTLSAISIYLSFKLFSNISEDYVLQAVWGSAAIGFEVIKFGLVPVATYLIARHHFVTGLAIALIVIALMIISITASIGSLEKNVVENDAPYYEAVEKKESKQDEISSLEEQIETRKASIKVYQKEEKITLGANVLQDKNAVDLEKISLLKEEIAAIKIPERSTLSAAIDSIAIVLQVDPKSAQANVYVAFSAMLDVIAALALLIAELIYMGYWNGKYNTKDEVERLRKLAEEKEKLIKVLKQSNDGLEVTSKNSLESCADTQALLDVDLHSDREEAEVISVDFALVTLTEKIEKAITLGEMDKSPKLRTIVKQFNVDSEMAERALDRLEKKQA